MAGEFVATLRTRHFPPLVLDSDELLGVNEAKPSGASAGGARAESRPPLWLRLVKPSVTLVHPFGKVVKAPAGDPGESTWPLVPIVAGLVLVGLVALAVVGVVSLVKR